MRCDLLITVGVWIGPFDAVAYRDGWWILVVSYAPPMRPARRAPPSVRDASLDAPSIAKLAAFFTGEGE